MSLYNYQNNFHYNHNKLSSGNPFNYDSYSAYKQRQPAQPQTFNNNPIINSSQFNTQINPNLGVWKTSTYNAATGQFQQKNNFSATMSKQERATIFGQDADENYFKHSLRKAPNNLNPIQSSSYNIINNIPYGAGNPNSYAYNINRQDNVAGLWGGGPSYFYNNRNNINQYNESIGLNRKENKGNLWMEGNKNCSEGQGIMNDIGNNPTEKAPTPKWNENVNTMNQMNSGNYTQKKRDGLGQETSHTETPMQNRDQNQKKEKQNPDLPEYSITNCSAVIEYSYKEDPNSRFRDYMEDRGKAIDCFNSSSTDALFCLFDGHGGGEVSKYLQDNFADHFRSLLPSKNIESTLINIFETMDQKIKNNNFCNVGSTGCVVYITKEFNKRILYCANVGDTRCVLIKNNKAVRLSYDDRASDKNEYNRIISAGGIVFAGRVYGQLMLSRAFGDWELKPYGVICVPHVTRIELESNDKYIVMGSDGIWDVYEDEEVFKIVNQRGGNVSANDLCQDIIHNSLQRGTMDNISLFVVKLN